MGHTVPELPRGMAGTPELHAVEGHSRTGYL